ncbi:MAG: hypothetical protein AAB619_04280 [Patescibacteria group bacterium]
MRQTTLILVIALAVVIIGGGLYLWLNKTTVTLPWAKTTNTATTTNTAVTNAATNTAPKTITLPTEVKGDTTVTGKLTVGAVEVTINSQQKQASADNVNADKGQTFLLVYFDAIDPADVLTVDRGLRDVKLTAGQTTYPLLSLKVASTYVKGDRGFMKFAVPEKAANLQLQLGSGATLQTVKLP